MASTKTTKLIGPTLYKSRALEAVADTGTTVAAVEIPAGTFVPPYGVTVYIPEAWAGGTPSIDVGDGDDADGWVDTLDVTETTIGTYSGSETNSPIAVRGKYYASADTIDVVLAASSTAGTAYIFVLGYDLSDEDVAAA